MYASKKLLRKMITLSMFGNILSPAVLVQAQDTVQINPAIYLQLQNGEPVAATELSYDIIRLEGEGAPGVVWSYRQNNPPQETLTLPEGEYTLRIYDPAGFEREGEQLSGLYDAQPASQETADNSFEQVGAVSQLGDGTAVYDIPFTVNADQEAVNSQGQYEVDLNVVLADQTSVQTQLSDATTESQPTDTSSAQQNVGSIQLTVVDEMGNPVPNVVVQINNQDYTSDAAGQIIIEEAPVGDLDYTVTSVPEGYSVPEEAQTGSLQVQAEQVTQNNITLQPLAQAGSVVIVVQDINGSPIPNVGIQIGEQELTTNEGGEATFNEVSLGEQIYSVTSLPEGYTLPEGTTTGTVTVSEGQPTGAIVTVQPVQQTGQVTIQVRDESGMGIPDATVQISEQEATTNQAGEAQFAEVPEGEQVYTITSVPEGYTLPEENMSRTITVNADQPNVVEAVINSAEQQGTVTFNVADEQGQPITNVTIQVNEQEVTTDANGVATLEEVPEGEQNYTITSIPEEYEPNEEALSGTFTVFPNQTNTVQVSLTTVPQVGQLTLTISSEDNNPVEGVIVELNDQTYTSNAQGEISIDSLEAGEYTYTVIETPGTMESGQTGTVTIEPNQINTQEISLATIPQYGNVSIAVVDQSNQPVVGATVTINGTEYPTNANGEVIVEALEANQNINYTLNSLPEGYTGQDAGTIEVVANETSSETITVQRDVAPGQLAIQIIDQNGEPVPGAVISLNSEDNDGETAQANEQGIVTFQELPVGEYRYELIELPERYSHELDEQTVQIEEGQTIDRSITVERDIITRDVRVRVVDQEGQPVEGATVTIEGDQTTNNDGIATFSDLEPGNYTYSITNLPENYEGNPVAEFTLTEEQDVELTAQVTRQLEPGSATIRVVDQNNEPIEGVTLAFGGLTGVTNDEGYVTFETLDVGLYNYSITEVPDGYSTTAQSKAIDITEGLEFSDQLMVQKVPQIGNVSIRIVDTNGNPVPNVTVTINNQTVQTNEQGIATFNDLEAGDMTYQISNVPSEYTINQTSGTVTVTSGETTETELEVQPVASETSESSSEIPSSEESRSSSDESQSSASSVTESEAPSDESLTAEQESSIETEAAEATRKFVHDATGVEVWVNPQDAGKVVRLDVQELSTPLDPQPQALEGKEADVYRITLLDRNNEPVQLTRIAQVRIPTKPIQSQIRLVRINDANTSNLTFGVHNQIVTFNTQQLGTFGIVYGDSQAESESQSVNVEVSSSVEESENLPGTGEGSSIAYIIAGTIIAIGGIGLIINARKKSKKD